MLDRFSKYWPEALSIVRIVVGLLFLEHGTAKLFGFPHTTMAQPEMGTLLWFQGVIELAGGALFAIGFFTRPVAFILAGDMAVAYFMAHAPKGLYPLRELGSDIEALRFYEPIANANSQLSAQVPARE